MDRKQQRLMTYDSSQNGLLICLHLHYRKQSDQVRHC